MLTKKQFDILTYLAAHPGLPAQRRLAAETKMSTGTVNQVLRTLWDLRFVVEGRGITAEGMEALEPYRVKRAVFLAAGFGSRMVPITLNTPKPLVRVRGIRIIDSLLDAVLAAGIQEIYIVRGYLREHFDQLLYKYPMIQFIDNPLYSEIGAIYSLICAGERIRNAYLFESDVLLNNPALITPYQYESNFLGIPMARTDDNCFDLRNGYMTNFRLGGTNCHQFVGIMYWSDEDGARLARQTAENFRLPGGKERNYISAATIYQKNDYHIAMRECAQGDAVEIDTFNELKAIDPAYGRAGTPVIL